MKYETMRIQNAVYSILERLDDAKYCIERIMETAEIEASSIYIKSEFKNAVRDIDRLYGKLENAVKTFTADSTKAYLARKDNVINDGED